MKRFAAKSLWECLGVLTFRVGTYLKFLVLVMGKILAMMLCGLGLLVSQRMPFLFQK